MDIEKLISEFKNHLIITKMGINQHNYITKLNYLLNISEFLNIIGNSCTNEEYNKLTNLLDFYHFHIDRISNYYFKRND